MKKGKRPPQAVQQKLFADEDIPDRAPPGKKLVYSAVMTTRNGRRIFAKSYGLKAFCFCVAE
jgi:hypothetical protein